MIMNKEELRLAQQIMAVLNDVVLLPNKDIFIEVADKISVKVTEHVYGRRGK